MQTTYIIYVFQKFGCGFTRFEAAAFFIILSSSYILKLSNTLSRLSSLNVDSSNNTTRRFLQKKEQYKYFAANIYNEIT